MHHLEVEAAALLVAVAGCAELFQTADFGFDVVGLQVHAFLAGLVVGGVYGGLFEDGSDEAVDRLDALLGGTDPASAEVVELRRTEES